MTVCSECGASLDPTVIHVRHFGCSSDDWDDCGCPEVCADCCTDPGCLLREPQETNVTDPAASLFTDVELEQWKRIYERSGDRVSMHREFALTLIATVEQVRRERDEAADTLRQARQLRDLLMTLPVDHLDGKWVSWYVDLLDLLSSPVSPDTPTPTGQT